MTLIFRKFTVYIVLICTFFASSSYSQITFQKVIGSTDYEEAVAVVQTSDLGYIMTGFTYGMGAGQYDTYLIKTDFNGDTLWTKIYGGTGNESGRSVQQTNDDGYIITGYTSSTPGTDADIFLIKTDASGNLLWTTEYGGPANEYGLFVQQTVDNGYILAGQSQDPGSNPDGFLIKTNSVGDTLWTKSYGGIAYDKVYMAQETSDHGFIVSGFTNSFGSIIGTEAVYILRTDSIGDVIWSKAYDNLGTIGFSVKQITDGSFIVTGIYYDNTGLGSEILLFKIDSAGNLLWAKNYGGSGDDQGDCVIQTADGGFAICGSTNSFGAGLADMCLVKTDDSGNIQWSKSYGGTGTESCGTYDGLQFEQTTDGGYIMVGGSDSYGAGGIYADIYFIKTDSSGNSPCNQTPVAFLTGTPALQTLTANTIVSSPYMVVSAPVWQIISGGIINTLCTSVSTIENPLDNLIQIFPNPFNSTATLISPTTIKNGTLNIFNSLGAKVKSYTLTNVGQLQIQKDNLPAGMYFYKLSDNDRCVSIGKLMIE